MIMIILFCREFKDSDVEGYEYDYEYDYCDYLVFQGIQGLRCGGRDPGGFPGVRQGRQRVHQHCRARRGVMMMIIKIIMMNMIMIIIMIMIMMTKEGNSFIRMTEMT